MDHPINLSESSAFPDSFLNPANPCVMIIFGIAGDLTKRLLFPGICNLGSRGLLNKNFCIVGIAQESYTEDSFRKQLRNEIDEFVTDAASKKFGISLLEKVYYISGDFSNSKVYATLKKKLEALSKQKVSKNYLFYFAAPPECMETIATELDKASLLDEENNHFRRIVIEKPFGHDLDSAIKLNQLLLSKVEEKQIFRVDHFLGKEPVQNLLAFRFSNSVFEPIWNHLYIDHIQITVAETLGVELRGSYYEQTGALRDMVPNHIFQLLGLIAMEPPISFSTDHIHEEKLKALKAVQAFSPENVLNNAIRGQYSKGKIKGVTVPPYRSEKNVSPESMTETYVALKLFLDNWRWLNVPFYIRTGKRMPFRTSEIIVQFKSGPPTLFEGMENNIQPNYLKIYIEPDEGISMVVNSKIPGPKLRLNQVEIKFKYSDYFNVKPQTGYETILYDCMNGDHLLFKQADIVELGWAIVQPILDIWSALPPRHFPNYAAGTEGPSEADELLERDGRKWVI